MTRTATLMTVLALTVSMLTSVPAQGGNQGDATATATGEETVSAPDREIGWFATGDSYSAGVGLLDAESDCVRSENAHAPLVRDQLRQVGWTIAPWTFTPCLGYLVGNLYNETSTDVDGQQKGWRQEGSLWDEAMEQLEAQGRNEDTPFDLITLSFGGNDIGFGDVIAGCVALSNWSVRCKVAFEELAQRVDNLAKSDEDLIAESGDEIEHHPGRFVIDEAENKTGSLADFYSYIYERHLAETDGHLLITGYPRLFADSQDWNLDWYDVRRCSGIHRDDADMLNSIAVRLNTTIRTQVREADAGRNRIHYMPTLAPFIDNTLCGDNDPWVNALWDATHACREEEESPWWLPDDECVSWEMAFHPNVAGYSKKADLLVELLTGLPWATDAPTVTSWVSHIGTGAGDVFVTSMAPTADGGVIATGRFEGTASFDDVTLTSAGSFDGVTLRLDGTGEVVWASHTGTGSDGIFLTSMTPAADGGVIVTGSFEGTANFGGTTLTSAGSRDGVTLKVDEAGEVAWVSQTGTGSDSIVLTSNALAADGGAIVTGVFKGTARFGETTLTSEGNSDGVALKLDRTGQIIWVSHSGAGPGHNRLQAAAATTDGGAIITGSFVRTARFGEVSLDGDFNLNGVTLKLDSSGDTVWATHIRPVGDPTNTFLRSAVTVTADGGAIITGDFDGAVEIEGTTLSSGGNFDSVTFKLDNTGEVVWISHIGTGPGEVVIWPAKAAPDGGALATGSFEGMATFGAVTLAGAGGHDGTTLKFDQAGRVVWATHTGTGADDVFLGSIAATPDGGAIVAGVFSGTATFGERHLTSAGGWDAVMFKVDADGQLPAASGN